MDRKTKLLCMKDILEHLEVCFDEWQGADSHNERFLAESIERDLAEFGRLCHSMKRDNTGLTSRRQAAFA